MDNNLELYENFRTVPENAKRQIAGGKLKGKTDINPMWRIKALTERFGPCGTGWGYTIEKQWTEAGANGEVAAFCNILLWYILEGEKKFSPGTGGSMLIQTEKGQLSTNDEAYKMALTDAISVACKQLGVGANIYWEADESKYGRKPDVQIAAPVCEMCGKPVKPAKKTDGSVWATADIFEWTKRQHGKGLCWDCHRAMKALQAATPNGG